MGSVAPYMVSGVLAGAAGLLTFLMIHHIWIRPIWSILPAGLAIAAIGGLAVGWCFHELAPHLPGRPWAAPAIVALIAVTLAPSIVLGQLRPALLDVTTMAIPSGQGLNVTVHFMLELVLTAALAGGIAGWLIGRSMTASLATGAAGVAFALGPGHNIPLLGNSTAAMKGALVLAAIVLVSAAILVEANALISRR